MIYYCKLSISAKSLSQALIYLRCLPCLLVTRSTHAYDAKCHAQMGHAAQVSGVACLVGVQRTVQNNGNVKSEPKYLVKNLQYVLSTVELFLALLASTMD